jgi:hypothetical protein
MCRTAQAVWEAARDFRSGSNAVFSLCRTQVRFSPDNELIGDIARLPFGANRRHRFLFDHLVGERDQTYLDDLKADRPLARLPPRIQNLVQANAGVPTESDVRNGVMN